ncbi:MAG: hypothetical protein KGZ89_07015 [Actinobacteria bacterium]|nr:hypothetical protein [Actinomycetota bacterium]
MIKGSWPVQPPTAGALGRSVGGLLVALLAVVALSGCGMTRITAVGPGDSVRLSDSWTIVVPDGWEGDIIRHGRGTLEEMNGIHSDIALSEPEREHETLLLIQVITEELSRKRAERDLEREGARLVRDTPEIVTVIVEQEGYWSFNEHRSGPAGEHLWISVLRGDQGPWMPEVPEGELSEHLVELLQLSKSE